MSMQAIQRVSPLAGKLPPPSLLIDVPRLIASYYSERPDPMQWLARLTPQQIHSKELAGEPIKTIVTKAPGNGASIGGLKVIAESGWFAARLSGTENIYKIYAESFRGRDHLQGIQEQAQTMVNDALMR